MNILAFDCSTEDIYIYIRTDKVEFSKKYSGCKATEYLITKIDDLLKKAEILISQVECVGVGVGPGSFTGSRVAVVTAKALAIAIGVKLIKFNSFELLSYNEKKDKFINVVEGFSDFVYAEGSALSPVCIKKTELKKIIGDSCIISRSKQFDGIKHIITDYNLKNVVESKLSAGEFINIDELEPYYLRASQAEIQLEERKKRL